MIAVLGDPWMHTMGKPWTELIFSSVEKKSHDAEGRINKRGAKIIKKKKYPLLHLAEVQETFHIMFTLTSCGSNVFVQDTEAALGFWSL